MDSSGSLPPSNAPDTRNAMPGLIALYRWRLHPGSEQAFIDAWSKITELLRARGSLGSRLHHGADGLWYGYAQWPSSATRDAAFALGSPDPEASARMKQAIAESLPELLLEPVADYLAGPRD